MTTSEFLSLIQSRGATVFPAGEQTNTTLAISIGDFNVTRGRQSIQYPSVPQFPVFPSSKVLIPMILSFPQTITFL